MERERAEQLLAEIGNDWELHENGCLSLQKTYRFKDFVQALDFVNRVGALAQEQAHHPDIYLTWGRVALHIWTHKIKGLTESDFILAAKCDRL